MSKLRGNLLVLCAMLCVAGAGGRESRAAKVDFLWVIDNSPSMAGEQAVLSAAADDIATQLANARCTIDWRMAVAYTDLHLPPSATDTCVGAPGPGRRRLCPFTTDIDVFRNGTPQCAYVKAGTCGDGSERGFNSARVAIDRFAAGMGCEPAPGGACTLRPDAQLAVIFMTDTGEQTTDAEAPPAEPDNSVLSWINYFSDYDVLRPGAQRALVNGLLCPLRPTVDNPVPCSDRLPDPALFDRYSQVIAAMGGTEGSIRNTDMMDLNAAITQIVDAAIAGACCGNGVIDPGEDCDDGNQVNGDCCSSNCQFEPATTLCRPAAGPCDVADFCTGTSAACPSDAKKKSVCRAAAGPCDVAERCDGTHDTCPADAFKSADTECRAAAGVCDTAESCTGTDTSCPADVKKTADLCRPAAGPCDVDERCDGTHDACPADGFQAAGMVCRAAAGACDAVETCTGSAAACPADVKRTDVCRPATGPCDVAETCDGTHDTCPADGFKTPGTECRASAGACDVAEVCSGSVATCPSDKKKTGVCRSSAGPCDAAESCDGTHNDCPADAFQPSTATCRASAGACDGAELCTGSSAACPPDACPGDAFKAAGTECRAAAGACDVAESCTGSAAACPADVKRTDVCRPAAGACDVAESCDGTHDDCPADTLQAAGTVCRVAAGACDAAESCTGSDVACPADVKKTDVCRPAAGACDVAESCDGTHDTCPADGFMAAGTECRAAAGVCDVAESCTGSAP